MHHHFLYGMDDGPKTYEDMTAMLRRAYEDGIRKIIATPHATPGHVAFAPTLLLQRLKEAQYCCMRHGFDLTLYSGAEIMYTPQAAAMVADGRIPTLANTKNVLVEFMPDVTFKTVDGAIQEFLKFGYIPILAHMERYRCLMTHIKRTIFLKELYPVAFQVNCSTVLGGKDFFTSKTINTLFEEKLIDHVATDAHDCTRRPCRMRSAYYALVQQVGGEYARFLTGMTEVKRSR